MINIFCFCFSGSSGFFRSPTLYASISEEQYIFPSNFRALSINWDSAQHSNNTLCQLYKPVEHAKIVKLNKINPLKDPWKQILSHLILSSNRRSTCNRAVSRQSQDGSRHLGGGEVLTLEAFRFFSLLFFSPNSVN